MCSVNVNFKFETPKSHRKRTDMFFERCVEKLVDLHNDYFFKTIY